MNIRAYLLLLAISISIVSIAQKKTTEHKIKEVTGVGVGGQSQTPEQVLQKAINDAKVNALKKAGVAENINSYTDYFRSETEDKMEELFTSDVLSNINGTVKNIDIVEQKLGITPEGQLKYDVIINCTVVRYKTKKDLAFSAWIDGFKSGYKVGEGLSFTVKPTNDCYLRAFVFTDQSYVLLPNEYEKSFLLKAHTEYTFPDLTKMDPYSMYIEDPKKKRETNRMVIILLKNEYYYTGEIEYKEITDWIMSIPPDERLIESFAFEIFRE